MFSVYSIKTAEMNLLEEKFKKENGPLKYFERQKDARHCIAFEANQTKEQLDLSKIKLIWEIFRNRGKIKT